MANDPLFTPTPWSDLGAGALAGGEGAPALEAGMVVAGKYRLERPAGFGGMGVVWVARNESTNAEVAVKILVTSRQDVDEEQVTRFRREAHAAAQLHHRGIVRVFDLVELASDGEAYGTSTTGHYPAALVMVMELLRGETLASLFDTKRRFTLEETAGIVLPLLSALAHAHAQGIVHRDVKPENIFLSTDPDGHVTPKILDFGISKLNLPTVPKITTDGATLGTPSYMSPEQARGMPDVDARSDVFAAGILLYEMLSGKNPFSSGSYHSVVAAVLERDPLPLKDVPPEVWAVVKRALEKPPALRYADAAELAAALRAATQAVGVTADASGGYPPPRGSLGDRSVPPAPYRDREPTTPSLYVKARRQARARASLVVVGVVAGFALVMGLYARAGRVERAPAALAAPPSTAATAVTPAAAPGVTTPAILTVVTAPSAPNVPSSQAAPPSAPSVAAGVVPSLPVTPHVRTSVVSAFPTAPPVHAAPHAAKPPPIAPPAATSVPVPAPAAPKSSVVRDPGF